MNLSGPQRAVLGFLYDRRGVGVRRTTVTPYTARSLRVLRHYGYAKARRGFWYITESGRDQHTRRTLAIRRAGDPE